MQTVLGSFPQEVARRRAELGVEPEKTGLALVFGLLRDTQYDFISISTSSVVSIMYRAHTPTVLAA